MSLASELESKQRRLFLDRLDAAVQRQDWALVERYAELLEDLAGRVALRVKMQSLFEQIDAENWKDVKRLARELQTWSS